MNTVKEIESAVTKLPLPEMETIRDWLDEVIEEQLRKHHEMPVVFRLNWGLNRGAGHVTEWAMKLFGMVCLSCLLLGTASLPAYTIRIPTKPAPGKTWVPLDRPLVPLEEQRGRGYRPDMVAPDFEKSKTDRPLRERSGRIKPFVEKPLYEPSSHIKTLPEKVKFDRPMFQRPVFDGKHAIWSQTPKTTPKQAGWLKPIFVK